MLAKRGCMQMRDDITKEWRKVAFHNEEITVEEMLRDYEIANEDYRCNVAGKIVDRISRVALDSNRIQRGDKWFCIESRNNGELKRWLDKIKNINVVRWTTSRYDLKVQKIEFIRDDDVKKVTLTLKAKWDDEGFEGGAATLWYERERLQEEWKVKKFKKDTEN